MESSETKDEAQSLEVAALITESTIRARYNISKKNLRELIAHDCFPKPYDTLKNTMRWRSSDIERFDVLWREFKLAKEFLSTEDVCERYGISDRTLRNWISQGRFPKPVRLGNATAGYPRWPRSVLESYDQIHIDNAFLHLKRTKIKTKSGPYKGQRALKRSHEANTTE